MKKLFLIFTIFILSKTNAQYFQLTNNGLTTTTNENFIVVDFPGMNKKDIYKKTLSSINSLYRSGKEVTNVSENESITINGRESSAVEKKFTLEYKLNFMFKDGKMRVDVPQFEMYSIASGFGNSKVPLSINRTTTMQMGWWIYSRDGKLNKPKAKADLENFFNNLVTDIKKTIETNSNW